MREAKDGEVWDYALKHQATIITKVEDFVDRFRRKRGGPAIVWIRMGNSSTRILLVRFLPLLEAMEQRLKAGDRMIEVR